MISYNAYLEFNGESFALYVTKMLYSLNTLSKGDSQARRGRTIYPYRVMRSDPQVTCRFRSVDEYKEFASFIRRYHKGIVGDSYNKVMRFISPQMVRDPISRTILQYGISPSRRINFGVTIESVQFVNAYNIEPAPEITFTMRILDDEYMDLVSASSGKNVGNVSAMVGNTVYCGEIESKGDNAFANYSFSTGKVIDKTG